MAVETQVMPNYSRQQDIINPDKLAQYVPVVIGVGAIGRQVALQLSCIGCQRLWLIDSDYVDTVNLPTQGYYPKDVGRAKVAATADMCCEVNPTLLVTQENIKYFGHYYIPDNAAIFCCVDNIKTRGIMWRFLHNRPFICDGRMAAEVFRIITSTDAQRYDYKKTLFNENEAYVGACTAKSTIYCANIAAGFMVAQYTQYLRNIPSVPDIVCNILTGEMREYNEKGARQQGTV